MLSPCFSFSSRSSSFFGRGCCLAAAGFTLLEILIALLVLTLGVLGGSAMQLSAMRTRHQSALLSQSTQLATALAERMRANALAWRLPDGANPYLGFDYDALAEPDPALPAPLCYAGGGRCGVSELARFDLYELKMLVRQHLPAGRAVVCRDSGLFDGGRLRWPCADGAGAALVIKVGWHGKNPDGTPARDDDGAYAPGAAIALTSAGAP